MGSASNLPGVLAEIAAAADEEAALAVASARGGTEVYIPPEPKPDHWLSRLVGYEAARAIADRLTCGVGGARVVLPLGPQGHQARARAMVDRLIREGELSARDIARATGYTVRGVERRIAKLSEAGDERQLPLFDS